MSDGVMLHGTDGAVLTTNPAAEALLGLSGDQLRGRAAMHLTGSCCGPTAPRGHSRTPLR